MYAGQFHFYGEEEQSQGKLIEVINREFDPPIPQIEQGMCYMLAIQFLLDYLGDVEHALPERIFDRITADHAYLRQIAGNFREYKDHGRSLTVAEATQRYVELLSKRHSEARLVGSFSIGTILRPAIDNPVRGHLILFYFKNESGTRMFGHAVAAVQDQDTYCLYDPNFGIYRTKNADDIYRDVLPTVYNPRYIDGSIYAVNKRKLD